jgi:hypothetical protein
MINSDNLQLPNSAHRGLAAALPEVFLVGAPKSGTTAMSEYLGMHPDIFMARKEMHFFGKDLEFGRRFYRRDRAAYLAEFAGRSERRRAGESSVWYLLSKRAAVELREFNPQARVIIMLRSPAAMLYSLYHQFRYDGNEHLPTFEAALQAEAARSRGECITRKTYLAQGLMYHQVPRYTAQVCRYLEVFGRHRVKVIIYDDFAAETARVYKETLEFLGVDANFGPSEFKVINGAKTFKPSAVASVLSEPWLRATAVKLGLRLPRSVFRTMQNFESTLRKRQTSFQPAPPLARETAERLRQEFTPEVEQLSELLDRDLTHWNRELQLEEGRIIGSPQSSRAAVQSQAVEAPALT